MKLMQTFTAALAICAAAFSGASYAANWDLDTSFANQGRQTLAFDAGGTNTDRIVKILRYPDNLNGFYVAVGSASLANGGVGIAMTRFFANGNVDTSFGTNGVVLKDACMTQVTNAAFDSFYRIVVVGTTSCSGNATTDVAVVRFTAQGADDTSFAGDGSVAIKYRPAFDENDNGGAVLVLADDSLLVGGNISRSAAVQKVSVNGVVSALSPALSNTQGLLRQIVDVQLGQSNSSFWLISNVGQNLNNSGSIWKLNNASLGQDTSFGGSDGEQPVINEDTNNCGTGAQHRVSALVRFGTRVYAFGFTTGAISHSFMVGFGENDGSVPTYRCLEKNATAVNFTTLDAIDSGDAGGSIYLGGSCGAPENFCLWRAVKADASATSFIPDASFNGGAPVTVSFSAGSGQAPQSNAFSMVRHGNKTVLAGLRVWNLTSGDFDFALARFGADDPKIFANGFEN